MIPPRDRLADRLTELLALLATGKPEDRQRVDQELKRLAALA